MKPFKRENYSPERLSRVRTLVLDGIERRPLDGSGARHLNKLLVACDSLTEDSRRFEELKREVFEQVDYFYQPRPAEEGLREMEECFDSFQTLFPTPRELEYPITDADFNR